MNTLPNVNPDSEWVNSPDNSFAAVSFPKSVSSSTGVSVEYVPDNMKKWFVFRASYGREEKASDYLINDGTYVYVARCYKNTVKNGRKKRILTSIIPGLLFVYTSKNKADAYIKETPELKYLSYYYDHFRLNNERKNPPLIVTNHEMENFILATSSNNEHLRIVDQAKCSYKVNEIVRVIDGPFKGVVGRVARVAGQQRVIVNLRGVCALATAYIPTAFLCKADDLLLQ